MKNNYQLGHHDGLCGKPCHLPNCREAGMYEEGWHDGNTERKDKTMTTPNGHNRYQAYGIDANGKIVHAGTHGAPRMSGKVARRMHRKWLTWRAGYLATHPGNYPLRHCPQVVAMFIHPVGQRSRCRRFPVA